MKRQRRLFDKAVRFFYEKIWKKMGKEKDEKLEKTFRLFHTGTQAELEEQVSQYRKKQIGIFLLFLCLAMVLLFVIGLVERHQDSSIRIWRNSYGEGQKEESLVLEDGDTITFTVEEREYEDEERKEAFQNGFQWVKENMLLENQSTAEIRSRLSFVTEVPGGLTAEWMSEDPQIISNEGEVFNTDWQAEESHMVRVQLYLSYQEQTEVQYLNFYVKSPIYTEKELLIKNVKQWIQQKEKETRSQESFVIPTEVAGLRVKEQGAGKNYGWFLMFAAAFAFVFFYRSNRMKEQGKERLRQLEEDYPILINKLVLYLGAGMNLKKTLGQIAEEYREDLEAGRTKKRYAYEELIVMVHEMQAGAGEQKAYEDFGKRIGTNSYSKLLALLLQNRQKGNDGLLKALKLEEANAFFLRIDQAKRAGEEAGTKLLFPMLFMLLIVMAIVMAPALLQFQFY